LADVHQSTPKLSAGTAHFAAPGSPSRSSQRSKSLSRAQYINGILAGDRAILSRAITLIESSLPADRDLADEIVEE